MKIERDIQKVSKQPLFPPTYIYDELAVGQSVAPVLGCDPFIQSCPFVPRIDRIGIPRCDAFELRSLGFPDDNRGVRLDDEVWAFL